MAGERVSEPTPIGELLHVLPGEYGHSWPPKELAPGVKLMRRTHVKRSAGTGDKAQTPVGIETYLAPEIEDTRLYYWNLAQHNQRPEDDRLCAVCRGAGYVRHGELAPGQAGFGAFSTCPRWRGDVRRCEERYDATGWWR